MSLPTIRQTCRPHQDIFDAKVQDTVLDIGHLGQNPVPASLDPDYFFSRNVFTRAGQILMQTVFERLATGAGDGIVLLSDGMGGGKTHNLLSLGLLARHPKKRAELIPDHAHPELGEVKVVTFDGRESNEIIWGSFARQLGKESSFAPFLEPTNALGKSDWIKALGDCGPLIVMIDELPPYFDSARSKPIGNSDLSAVTATSLANLLVAINSGGLPHVTMVFTDLNSTSYINRQGEWLETHGGSDALVNFDKEASKMAVRLQPVDDQGQAELYSILRRRCFDFVDTGADRDAAIRGREALLVDSDLDGVTGAAGDFVRMAKAAYPFDHHLDEILYRTKDAKNFQSTRGLLRIAQAAVKAVFEDGSPLADISFLGPQHLSMGSKEVMAQVRGLNSKMEAAVLQGISNGGRAAAEKIDSKMQNPAAHVAERVATLIAWASLSSSGAKPGLTEDEIMAICLAENAAGDEIERVLHDLIDEAHYLYFVNGRYLFRDTENVRAAVQKKADELQENQWREALRAKLSDLLSPTEKLAYQDCSVFPTYDKVTLSPDERLLIALLPATNAEANARDWWRNQQLKNQIFFLFADPGQLGDIERAARRYKACLIHEADLKGKGVGSRDSEMIELNDYKGSAESNLYQAIVGSFRKLLFPNKTDLQLRDLEKRDSKDRVLGDSTNASLEPFITHSLVKALKLQDNAGINSEFAAKVVERAFPGDQMTLSDLRKAAASLPSIPWGKPKALDDLRNAMVSAGRWEFRNGFVTKASSAPALATIDVREQETKEAEVILHLQVNHGDGAEMRWTDANGKEQIKRFKAADGTPFTVEAPASQVHLKATSSAGRECAPEKALNVRAAIVLQVSGQGMKRHLVARTFPTADMRVTFDATDPSRSGTKFSGEIPIPENAVVIRVAALVGADVVNDVRQNLGAVVANGPMSWRAISCSNRKELFDCLEIAAKHQATVLSMNLVAIEQESRFVLTHSLNSERAGGKLKGRMIAPLRDELIRGLDAFASGQVGGVASKLSASLTLAFRDMAALERCAKDLGREVNTGAVEPIDSDQL